MEGRYFYDADGELLFVPERGALDAAHGARRHRGEAGRDRGDPARDEVPRRARWTTTRAAIVCENFGAPFRLPDLGPIGSNGLANPRDFLTPVAAYEDVEGDFELVAKFGGRLWSARIDHSPLDVVAWHGNYAPYKYDLARFNAIGTRSRSIIPIRRSSRC